MRSVVELSLKEARAAWYALRDSGLNKSLVRVSTNVWVTDEYNPYDEDDRETIGDLLDEVSQAFEQAGVSEFEFSRRAF